MIDRIDKLSDDPASSCLIEANADQLSYQSQRTDHTTKIVLDYTDTDHSDGVDGADDIDTTTSKVCCYVVVFIVRLIEGIMVLRILSPL